MLAALSEGVRTGDGRGLHSTPVALPNGRLWHFRTWRDRKLKSAKADLRRDRTEH